MSFSGQHIEVPSCKAHRLRHGLRAIGLGHSEQALKLRHWHLRAHLPGNIPHDPNEFWWRIFVRETFQEFFICWCINKFFNFSLKVNMVVFLKFSLMQIFCIYRPLKGNPELVFLTKDVLVMKTLIRSTWLIGTFSNIMLLLKVLFCCISLKICGWKKFQWPKVFGVFRQKKFSTKEVLRLFLNVRACYHL